MRRDLEDAQRDGESFARDMGKVHGLLGQMMCKLEGRMERKVEESQIGRIDPSSYFGFAKGLVRRKDGKEISSLAETAAVWADLVAVSLRLALAEAEGEKRREKEIAEYPLGKLVTEARSYQKKMEAEFRIVRELAEGSGKRGAGTGSFTSAIPCDSKAFALRRRKYGRKRNGAEEYGDAPRLEVVRSHERGLDGRLYRNVRGKPYHGSVCDECEWEGESCFHHPLRCHRQHPGWDLPGQAPELNGWRTWRVRRRCMDSGYRQARGGWKMQGIARVVASGAATCREE